MEKKMENEMETGIIGLMGIRGYMSCSLNSLKGVIYGTTIWVIKGDTRSLDNGSHGGIPHVTVDVRFQV